MYNVCTNVHAPRLLTGMLKDVCTTVHIPYSTYHVKTNPSQMTH